jgi:hypothetical protein
VALRGHPGVEITAPLSVTEMDFSLHAATRAGADDARGREALCARENLKDPYRFDFLGVGEEADERALEDALVSHITKFLLELGAAFAFVGRQVVRCQNKIDEKRSGSRSLTRVPTHLRLTGKGVEGSS